MRDLMSVNRCCLLSPELASRLTIWVENGRVKLHYRRLEWVARRCGVGEARVR